jgi:hypothetical protein
VAALLQLDHLAGPRPDPAAPSARSPAWWGIPIGLGGGWGAPSGHSGGPPQPASAVDAVLHASRPPIRLPSPCPALPKYRFFQRPSRGEAPAPRLRVCKFSRMQQRDGAQRATAQEAARDSAPRDSLPCFSTAALARCCSTARPVPWRAPPGAAGPSAAAGLLALGCRCAARPARPPRQKSIGPGMTPSAAAAGHQRADQAEERAAC